MKHFLKSSLLIISSLLCGICHFSAPTFAASFSLSSSAKQVSPGATFTVSVGGDCVGRVNIMVSGGTIPSNQTAIWVEENYQTVTVTAGSSGTVTVTATPEAGLSDPNGNEYKPGSRNVSVAIVTPTPPTTKPTTPATPTPPASTNQTKPSANSNSQTPENTPDTSEKSDNSAENQETENNETDNNTSPSDETSTEQIENTNSSNTCSQSHTTVIIAWIVAGIFGILFLSTLIALIYVLQKYRPTTTSEKATHSSVKVKNQKSNTEHKSKKV